MAKATPSTTGNGNGNFYVRLMNFAERVGLPTALLVVVVWFSGQFVVKPLVEKHSLFLDKTIDNQEMMVKTQESMAETEHEMATSMRGISKSVDDISKSVEEIQEVERETKVFMKGVQQCHDEQIKGIAENSVKLDQMIEKVEVIGGGQ